MGYDRSRFSGPPILPQLICSLCDHVFMDPVETAACQHVFCRKCVAAVLPSLGQCPEKGCHRPLTESGLKPIPVVLNAIIGALQISCSYASKGCPQIVELSQLKDHKKRCTFSSTALVKCEQDCGGLFKRKKIAGHSCADFLKKRNDLLMSELNVKDAEISILNETLNKTVAVKSKRKKKKSKRLDRSPDDLSALKQINKKQKREIVQLKDMVQRVPLVPVRDAISFVTSNEANVADDDGEETEVEDDGNETEAEEQQAEKDEGEQEDCKPFLPAPEALGLSSQIESPEIRLCSVCKKAFPSEALAGHLRKKVQAKRLALSRKRKLFATNFKELPSEYLNRIDSALWATRCPRVTRSSRNKASPTTKMLCKGCNAPFDLFGGTRNGPKRVRGFDYILHCLFECQKYKRLGLMRTCLKCNCRFLDSVALKKHLSICCK